MKLEDGWQPVDTIPLGRKRVELLSVKGIECVGYHRTYSGKRYIRPAARGLPRRVNCTRTDLKYHGDITAVAWREIGSGRIKSRMEQEAEKNNAKPLYYSDSNGTVYKRPVYTYKPENDACDISMGFAVLRVNEYIENKEEIGKVIAKLMSDSDTLT